MTKRLVDWIGPEALKIPFNIMAHNIGCTDSTIRNIFLEYTDQTRLTIPALSQK